ncbi:Chs5p-Arf1p-binding proteins-domain-containing protein [Polychytrium aggregatum]|uniref:Chs5p-Arf1p-binding proteins-domain-containing protein n=1 Tax=Polychytrium aggregatum TaxID=110093 RepID=UPI0022FF20EF|nr:Chs5p-Arf1p-binding proteins-domain-containing protein [Polychytrium aggregatum]KAI9202649.1 Chs5p-Arf1p-binding proteins-domain-containing protein [Polychytrium aggregatum]
MVFVVDSTVLRGIPEFFESELAECLAARTEALATFRELGPPDLCHVIKTNIKGQQKDIGSYHYVLGVDSSSSATVAAYLNSLMYNIEESQTWFGGKHTQWKIKSGTYCCFNAFSRVDIRVEVRIPGGVESYIVDLRGDKHPITNPAIWQETAVSAVLRSILDDNDEPDGNDGQPLLGLRKLDPLPTQSAEKRFLDAAKAEFWKAWQLGTDPEVQVATYYSNHLTNGIIKYFSDSGRHSEGVRFFEALFDKEPEVGVPLARSYLGMDEEIKAVQILHDSLKRQPLSYGLLLAQIDFLRSKKKFDLAVKLAKLAVTYAPSEFLTWAKLTETYIDMSDYESALLSLNSCPMFTYCERDAHRMPPPVRTHLPLKPDPAFLKPEDDVRKMPPGSGSLSDENDPRENEVHPELQRLPALSLRGTFLKAYQLLIRILNKNGWDELLKFRSNCFVMEEEYRIHRSLAEEEKKGGASADDADELHESLDDAEDIPLSDAGAESATESRDAGAGLPIDELIKKAGAEAKGDGKQPNPRPLTRKNVAYTFRTKRLCEKWLDNLFMVLYNDLRLYTALKQEITQYKSSATGNTNALLYRKTGAEWEIYGDLAARLGHKEDAKEAYKMCLEQKLSVKSHLKLMEVYSDEGHLQNTLESVVKLTGLLDRAYVEHTYPSPVARAIFKLIRRHGLAKVTNGLISMNVPQKQYRMVTRFFDYAELFKVEGVNW